ncbi:hypothetical protein BKA62DRAFT_760421 [Auriculariales sp. MPI-PUGE-AT-0066]|nr:hypothetical protein BKA62DRAFT_760421 [Auriculariales sp. MPI-PUGE-AT-0066]
MQKLVILALGCGIVPALCALPPKRDCTVYEFWDTGFLSGWVYATAHRPHTGTGQVITATVVNAATCLPYTGASPSLVSLTGTTYDSGYNGDPSQGSPSTSVIVHGTNTVTFVATVPDGSTNLDLQVSGNFTPGGLDNYGFVVNQLGVVYTTSPLARIAHHLPQMQSTSLTRIIPDTETIIHFDQGTLARDYRRLDELESERRQALEEAEDALIALAAAEDRAGTLNEEIRLLSQAVEHQSVLLERRRRYMNTFPVELLRAILIETVALSPEEIWPVLGDGLTFDRERAKLPFIVAAVSQRWRSLALATSEIWHYLAVPVPSQEPRAVFILHRVKTVLKRSRYVDIALHWCDGADYNVCPYSSRIVAELAKYLFKWRTFQFTMPFRATTQSYMDVFRGPAPYLQRFYILGSNKYVADINDVEFRRQLDRAPPRYLPRSLQLREIFSQDTNVVPACTLDGSEMLHHLKSLTVTVNHFSLPWLWDTIVSAPHLVRLMLYCNEDLHTGGHVLVQLRLPATTVTLSSLQDLYLRDNSIAEWFMFISAHQSFPRLRCISIPPESAQMFREHSFHRRCSSVTTLKIHGGRHSIARANVVQALERLAAIRDLAFEGVTIHQSFASVLSEKQDTGLWLLPQLENISVERCAIKDIDSVIRLVEIRSRHCLDRQNMSLRPANLNSVKIDAATTGVDPWHRAEIRQLLGQEPDIDNDDASIIEDLDTANALPEQEDEAVATDGSGSSDTSCDSDGPMGSDNSENDSDSSYTPHDIDEDTT